MKKVKINIVDGEDGYSLQIIDKNGGGYRYAGPKAWGNPMNIPTCTFVINDLEDFIKCLKKESWDEDE